MNITVADMLNQRDVWMRAITSSAPSATFHLTEEKNGDWVS